MNIYMKVRRNLVAFGVKETIKKIAYVKYQNKFSEFYYDKNSLEKVIKLGEKIVRIYPDNLCNYQQLARAYWKNKNDISAVNTLRLGINQNCQMDSEEVIKKIERIISPESVSVSSKLLFNGGHQNYGLIEHKYEKKILITKIIHKKDSRGEVLIKKLQDYYSFLNEVIPNIKSIYSIKDLSFVTMEKIDGQNPVVIDKNFLEQAINANRIISSVKVPDSLEYEPLPTNNLNAEPVNKHEIFKNLYSIHDKEVYSVFSEYLVKYNYPTEVINIINYLNSIIVQNKYYKMIKQEKYFSIQHGDFFKDNMILNKQTGSLKVIDWGAIRIGPKWVDIAVFLGVTGLTFQEINQIFLCSMKCNYNSIEKMFFMYTLIVTWAVICSAEELERIYKTTFTPALKFVDKLIKDLEIEKEKFQKV